MALASLVAFVDDAAIHIAHQLAHQREAEPLRIVERSIILPGSDTQWQFAVAASREDLDTQISQTRSILAYSFIILGLGLFAMAALQTAQTAETDSAPSLRGSG